MGDREPLNVRVSEDIKDAFDDAVAAKYGTSDAYAGFVLERELRAELDHGDIAAVRDAVEHLTETLSVTPRKKDTRDTPTDHHRSRTGDTTVLRYRVSATVKAAIDDRQTDAFRSTGQFVEAVMRRYAETDGELGHLAATLEAIADDVAAQTTSSDATRAEQIAARLTPPFTKRDFIDAAAAVGVTTEQYALTEYLRDVIDELDVVPAPDAPETFLSKSQANVPDTPDPTRLPYHALTRGDKRVVLKVAALRKLQQTRTGAKLTPAEGVDALNGRPNYSTVRGLYRAIADEAEANGFRYDDGNLKVHADQATAATDDNDQALAIVSSQPNQQDDESPGTDSQAAADAPAWVVDAAAQLEPLPRETAEATSVLTNKIARAKFADHLDETDELPDELFDRVTAEDRRRVKRYLSWTSTEDEDESAAQPDAQVALDGGTDDTA